jgi:hypothetical protein
VWPMILTTMVAVLLEASGSGVGSGGWELARARTAAFLDVPSGKPSRYRPAVIPNVKRRLPRPTTHFR